MKKIGLRIIPEGAVNQCGRFRLKASLLLCLFMAMFAASAWGAVPSGERTALMNLYTSANGAGWLNSSNWNSAAGSECSWYGVTCDAGGAHVLDISLPANNLTGSLPALDGLTGLQSINVAYNNLTGTIPSLSGLSGLISFIASNNQLSGAIPSLSGLTHLTFFYADSNQLLGTIPALSGLANLNSFYISGNLLSGAIPALSGLTNLNSFYVSGNQLSGTIPALSGLASLTFFYADNNQLTGAIPSLSGLGSLEVIDVSYNQLSGSVPSVPSPNMLSNGLSVLCPNNLAVSADAAWDAATGSTPWSLDCTGYLVSYNGNGSTGGSVPAGGTYKTGQTVTVSGNSGGMYLSGSSFTGWNTAANGSGSTYVGGDLFAMGTADVTLYAQWIPASGLPVVIAETSSGYNDIQSAYTDVKDGQTVEAQDGLGTQTPLLLANPVSFRLRGGYDATFTTVSGATLVSGSLVISNGSVDIGNIVIH